MFACLFVCLRLLAKLENWVFESDKPDAELKLIDFGLSTYFGKVWYFMV